MRIIFMGNPKFSIPSLKAVNHSDFKVVGVMTNPPKNMGRGRFEHHSPVCMTAKELGIPLIWDFMYAVRDQMMLNNKEFEAEDIESALENYIFPILYNLVILKIVQKNLSK